MVYFIFNVEAFCVVSG